MELHVSQVNKRKVPRQYYYTYLERYLPEIPKSIEVTEQYLMFTAPLVTTVVIWVAAENELKHYNDVIMGATASQITSLTIVYSIVYSDSDQRKHQSSTSLAFVWGIHRGSVNSPHKWPVTRKMFPFDDVIMIKDDYWEMIRKMWLAILPPNVSNTKG